MSTVQSTDPLTRSQSLLLKPRPLPVPFANRLFLAYAYAIDPLCNRRQMEYPWYSFWTLVLLDLIDGLSEYILFPQFPVWIIPPEGSDGADNESDIEPSPTPPPPNLDDRSSPLNFNPSDAVTKAVKTENADASSPQSSQSSQSSQSQQPTPPPRSKAKRFKLPDFAVVRLLGDTISEVDFDSLSEALESLRSRQIINHVLTPLIVEIKKDSESIILTDRYVTEAQAGALLQARFIFASSHQQTVVAIAAAGAKWTWTTIRRPDHSPVASPEEQDDPTYEPPKLTNPVWSDVFDFGSAASDAAFRKVFIWMTGLRRGRQLNHGFNNGVTTDVDEVELDSDDIQDSGASHSDLEDDATETESDRRRLTPSGDNRHYAGPRTPLLCVPPPTDSPDPLGSYSVGESHAGPRTPGPRAPGHRAPVPRAPSALAPPPTDSPDPLDTMGLPTTPSGKDTAKRNRATDSPEAAAARLTLPTCQVSPSSKPQRKRGKMHATTSSQPM